MKHMISRNKTTLALAFAVLAATTGFVAAATHDGIAKDSKQENSVTEAKDKMGDIVAVAEGAGNFKTLCAAVKAAGLEETLQGKGPFTVFAPTDEAFAKLPKGTLDELLKPENKEKLAGILTYHVLAGKVMAADVKTMKTKTVNGQSLDVMVEGGKVTVDKAKVIMADVAASNGVIHAIDTVLMPK